MQHRHVFGLQLIVADGYVVIDLAAAPPAAFRIERDHGHLARGEQLPQALHFGLRLVLALPAVFVVHVEDQIDRHILFDDARQQHPREEGLARAALAKHPARSFHQPFEVEIDADAVHVQRLAHVEETGLFFAEDLIHILGGRLDHAREVTGHGLNGLGLGRAFFQHQHRRDVQQAERVGADHHVAHEVVAHIRRDLGPARDRWRRA